MGGRKRTNIPVAVYGLVDPRDGLVHYVGMSVDVFKRYQAHVAINKNYNGEMNEWLRELSDIGLQPKLRIFSSRPDQKTGIECENSWIYKMYIDRHPLKNNLKTVGRAIASQSQQ